MPLDEGQWRLQYGAYGDFPAGDLTFGTFSTGYDLMLPPEVSGGDPRLGDSPLGMEDGVRFGRDYRAGSTITFEVSVDTASQSSGTRHSANLDAVGAMARVWRADALRFRSGAVASLTTRNGGRERIVYGRPRRFAPAATKLSRQGHTPVVCDFATVDDRWYDATEQTVRSDKVPPPSGGLKAPLKAPLTTVPSTSTVPGAVTIGGTLPAWPVFVIHGPLVNPIIDVVGLWQIGLTGSLTAGQVVTIDSRPWERTVLRDGTASLAGKLTRSSPTLAQMQLSPGEWQVVLSGSDATGTSYLEVKWRDTYAWM